MLQCISFKSTSVTSPAGNSLEGTPGPSNQPSPIDLSREFMLTVHTNSYNEMWSKIHIYDPNQDHLQVEDNEGPQNVLLSQVLHPNRQCVEEALSHGKPTTLTRLVTTYFNHSENTTSLCMALYQNVQQARDMYRPLYELIEVLPSDLDAISESQCNWAFDMFLIFDGFDNPFPCPDSHNFEEVRLRFSELKLQLDNRLRKSQSRIWLLRNATVGSVIFLITSVFGRGASGFGYQNMYIGLQNQGPFCGAHLPGNFRKRELARISLLDAAAKGTYVLNNDLDTIDRLVARLYTLIEGDKLFIRLGLERGRDIYSVQEVVKQFRKNHSNFVNQLEDLEQHLCLCFNTVNRARSLLLQEIYLHRTYSS